MSLIRDRIFLQEEKSILKNNDQLPKNICILTNHMACYKVTLLYKKKNLPCFYIWDILMHDPLAQLLISTKVHNTKIALLKHPFGFYTCI